MTLLCPSMLIGYTHYYSNPNDAGALLLLLMWIMSIGGWFACKSALNTIAANEYYAKQAEEHYNEQPSEYDCWDGDDSQLGD
jgi:hypothetical protein